MANVMELFVLVKEIVSPALILFAQTFSKPLFPKVRCHPSLKVQPSAGRDSMSPPSLLASKMYNAMKISASRFEVMDIVPLLT